MADSPVALQSSPPKTVILVLNALIGALLRSPLHGLLSGSTLVLSFKGRKSGKTYTFPVGYYDLSGDTLVIIPLHPWWKNLRGGVPVTVWLKGHRYQGTADARQGDEATIHDLERIVGGSANLMRVYRVQKDASGQPDAARIHQLAAALPLVHIRLTLSQ
jgi:hypothetical protein